MEKFLELIKKHRESDTVDILSVTPMTDSYLLAVRYKWSDGSVREEALLAVETMYGPKKGQMRLGWSNFVYSLNAPED